ncbi:MAG TPA: hypothetical protein ENK77_01925 [Epsilonproteobacteria bacterium]|nr:hypothetical protein [Campylobacterota bacterium]
MKLFKVLLLISIVVSTSIEVLAVGSHASGKKELQKYKPLKKNEGKKLKSLKLAMLSDVHLAKPVKYFDIRQYDTGGKYETGYSFDMSAYGKLTGREKKKIDSVRLVKPRNSFWKRYFISGELAGYYNLHYLDSNAEVYTINSLRELLDFLGTIDTPAELSIFLLSEVNSHVRYKKVGNVYIVRANHLTYSDCDGCNEPVCTLSVRHRVIDNRGNIVVDKWLYSKDIRSEKECSGF